MAWTQSGNIKGASGAPGASGATGPTGPAGPTGATGASGGTGGTGGPGTTNWADIVDKPGAILNYKGTWNASTNSPTLSDATGSGGDVYRVSVGASRNLGSGTIAWDVGDYAIWSPVTSSWEKADTTDAVSSVAGRTGAVALTKSDVGLGNADDTADINKNVLSATKLTTARTINGVSFDGQANITIPTGITRSVSTVTSNTTLSAAATTDYVTFANIAGDSATTLLLHGNGTNNATVFVDSSLSSRTVTRFGDAKISTAQSKFGGASMLFDGTGDYLTIPSTAGQLGSSTFTLEMWVYPVSNVSSFPTLWGNHTTFAAGSLTLYAGHASSNSTKYQVSIGPGGFAIVSTASITYNAWSHIAVVRNASNVITLYVNGVANGTVTNSTTLNGTSGSCWVGTTGEAVSSGNFNGYIDELRISNTARYTAAFTPPTEQFADPLAPTVTMPSVASVGTNEYRVKNIHATDTLTVATTSSQTIDGSSTLSLASGAAPVRLISDGSNWRTT